MPANLENSAVATGLRNVSFPFNLKKGNAKECSNNQKIALISHANKVILKILQYEDEGVGRGCRGWDVWRK